jgi:very-short-patch-repair endonuclease
MENGGSPQKGYKRSQEFKDRMSEIASNRDPALVKQKTEQMWAARRGQKMTDEQKAVYSEARTTFMIANPDKLGPKKLFNTKPELQFEQKLVEFNITYRKAYQCGGFLYDFLVNEDTIIEIDGPYHYNLNLYGSKSDPQELKLAGLKKTQDKDARKDKTAADRGLKIYRIKVGGNLPADWLDQLINQGCTLFL